MRLRVNKVNLSYYHPELQKKLQLVDCCKRQPYDQTGVYEADIELWEVGEFLVWHTHSGHRMAHLKHPQKCIGSVKEGENIYLIIKEI